MCTLRGVLYTRLIVCIASVNAKTVNRKKPKEVHDTHQHCNVLVLEIRANGICITGDFFVASISKQIRCSHNAIIYM